MCTNTESPISNNQNSDKPEFGPDGMKDYLIDYREGLWLSIRQKENGVWQFIAFFAGAVVLLASLFDKKNLPLDFKIVAIVSLMIILVSFWGVLIILNANHWENRNLWIISNIEWRFLGKKELGKLIPLSYANPEFRYSQMYSLHIYLLMLIINIILAGNILFFKSLGNITEIDKLIAGIVGILQSGLILFAIYNDSNIVRTYHDTRAKMIGNRDVFINYREYNISKNKIISPLLLFVIILSVLNSYFALTLLFRIGIKLESVIQFISISILIIVSVILILIITSKILIKKSAELIKSGISEETLDKNNNVKALKYLTRISYIYLQVVNWILIVTFGIIIIKQAITV